MSLHESEVLTRTGNEQWQSTIMDRHDAPYMVTIQAYSDGEPPYAVRDSQRMLIGEAFTFRGAAEIIMARAGLL